MNKEHLGDTLRETLSAMSTGVLREMLERELNKPSPADVNVDLLKEITAILDARDGQAETDVETAYERFLSEYLPCEMLYPEGDCTEVPASVTVLPRRRRLAEPSSLRQFWQWC